MIAFEAVAQVLILLASAAVLTVCASIWIILFFRMWRDFRPGKPWGGTIVAVWLWGATAGLCGLGAYTVATSAAFYLADML